MAAARNGREKKRNPCSFDGESGILIPTAELARLDPSLKISRNKQWRMWMIRCMHRIQFI